MVRYINNPINLKLTKMKKLLYSLIAITTLWQLSLLSPDNKCSAQCWDMDNVGLSLDANGKLLGQWSFVWGVNYPPAGTISTWIVILDGVQWKAEVNGGYSPAGTIEWGLGTSYWEFQGVDVSLPHTLCVDIACDGIPSGQTVCASYPGTTVVSPQGTTKKKKH
jgi:hypothetical protein